MAKLTTRCGSLNAKSIARNVESYDRANARWNTRFATDVQLALSADTDDEAKPPIICRVSAIKRNAKRHDDAATTVGVLAKEMSRDSYKPLHIDLHQVLFAPISSSHRNDNHQRLQPPSLDVCSLREIDVKRLGHRSIYYKRLYVAHLLVLIYVCEIVNAYCRDTTSNDDDVAVVGGGNSSHAAAAGTNDRHVLILCDERLRNVMNFRTLPNIVSRTDAKVRWLFVAA